MMLFFKWHEFVAASNSLGEGEGVAFPTLILKVVLLLALQTGVSSSKQLRKLDI